MKAIDGVILDFDGTLAPEVPEVAIAVLHETLARWSPVPLPLVRQYYRAVSAFRMDKALALLLESLGLEDKAGAVAEALAAATGWGAWSLGLDPSAEAFLKARPPGTVHVFSSGGSQAPRFAPVLALLGPEAFLEYRHCSKASPETWRTIAADRGWNPGRRVVVDDSPPALWAAKTAGFVTVCRTNTVFTGHDETGYLPWIDHRVGSLAELGIRFKPRG